MEIHSSMVGYLGEANDKLMDSAYNDDNIIKGGLKAFASGAIDGWVIGSSVGMLVLAGFAIVGGITNKIKKK